MRKIYTYERCYNAALKYETSGEFKQGNKGEWNAAYQNGWLKDYTWFVSGMSKAKTKYTYEYCYELASRYEYLKDFKDNHFKVFDAASKKGWDKDYTWLKKFKPKYTFDDVKAVAQKYTTLIDFLTYDSKYYDFAKRYGWLEKFDWFEQTRKERGYWYVYENNKTEAMKYASRREFEKGNNSAYNAARDMKWLDTYDWFEEKVKPSGYWNIYENNRQEALKYNSRTDFYKGNQTAYEYARINDWLDTYDWLDVKENPYNTDMHSIYAYEFTETKCVYVGLTINIKQRDRDHRTKKDSSVYRYSKENSVEIPVVKVLESGVSINDCKAKEDFYKKEYESKGWTAINKAKTGKGSGSIGKLGQHKWTYKACYELALTCKTLTEFESKSSSALAAAYRNGWRKDYTWFANGRLKEYRYCKQAA